VKYKVILSEDAEDDLFEIYKFIFLNDSKLNAEKLIARLRRKCFELEEYPERGHLLHELQLFNIHEFLEVHIKPYRIIYRIIKKEVFIHFIIDGRRDFQKLLNERLLR